MTINHYVDELLGKEKKTKTYAVEVPYANKMYDLIQSIFYRYLKDPDDIDLVSNILFRIILDCGSHYDEWESRLEAVSIQINEELSNLLDHVLLSNLGLGNEKIHNNIVKDTSVLCDIFRSELLDELINLGFEPASYYSISPFASYDLMYLDYGLSLSFLTTLDFRVDKTKHTGTKIKIYVRQHEFN